MRPQLVVVFDQDDSHVSQSNISGVGIASLALIRTVGRAPVPTHSAVGERTREENSPADRSFAAFDRNPGDLAATTALL